MRCKRFNSKKKEREKGKASNKFATRNGSNYIPVFIV